MTAGDSRISSEVWETNDLGTRLLSSTHETRTEYVKAISGDKLLSAARKLARHKDADKLKVASGEHVAGIVLSAFVGRLSDLDTDGGFDFLLDESPDSPPGEMTTAVVEVKSAPGKWRQHLRHIEPGQSYSIRIENHLDVLIDEGPRILKAVDQLSKKTTENGPSREVFLAIHPLDRATPPALSNNPLAWVTSPLPIPKQSLAIDGLWLLLYPSLVARWSQNNQSWTRYVVGTDYPGNTEQGADLIEAEFLFLKEFEATTGIVHDVVWHDGLS